MKVEINRNLKIFLLLFMLFFLKSVDTLADNSYEQRMSLATQLRIEGNCISADSIYSLVIEYNPDDSDALVGRGLCRIRDKESYESAKIDFKRAIEISPDYVDAYAGKARLLLHLSKTKQAKEVLEKCYQACKSDVEKVQYLATQSWILGFYKFARQLDNRYGKSKERELVPMSNSIFAGYVFSRLKDGSNWHQSSILYTRTIRPDIMLGLNATYYQRHYGEDFTGGLISSFRYNKNLSFLYSFSFSDKEGFVYSQRHNPKIVFALLPNNTIGIGGDFRLYTRGWTRFLALESTQYIDKFVLSAGVSAGRDNNYEDVVSLAGNFTYHYNNNVSFSVGASMGQESVALFEDSFRKDFIQSIFSSANIAITSQSQIRPSISFEWRERDYFLTSMGITKVYRF